MNTTADDTIRPNPAAPDRWTDFVHRLGESTAGKIKDKITSREDLIRKHEQEHDRALAKLRREREEALSTQERLNALQLEVDRIEDEITHAESTLSQFKVQLASLSELFLEGWGNPAVTEIGGPHYKDFVSFKAAIDDFPRVKTQLAKRLEMAQRELTEFERTIK